MTPCGCGIAAATRQRPRLRVSGWSLGFSRLGQNGPDDGHPENIHDGHPSFMNGIDSFSQSHYSKIENSHHAQTEADCFRQLPGYFPFSGQEKIERMRLKDCEQAAQRQQRDSNGNMLKKGQRDKSAYRSVSLRSP